MQHLLFCGLHLMMAVDARSEGGGKADIGIASRHTQPIRTQIISFFKNL